MATFSITIDDPVLLAGITYARNKHNNGLNVPRGQTLEEQPDYVVSDEDYVIRVLTKACESYANARAQEQIERQKNTVSVSRRQVFQGLEQMGLLATVQTFVASQPAEVQAEWAMADRFHRDNPMLVSAWAALNPNNSEEQNAAQLDAMFRSFAAI